MSGDYSFTLFLGSWEIEWVLYQLKSPSIRLYTLFETASSNDIQRMLDAAQNSLYQRNLLKKQRDKNLALDVTVASIIGVLGFSQVALFVNLFRDQESKPHPCNYFSAEGLIVEQTSTDNEEIALTALRDLDTLRARLHEHLGLQDQQAPREGIFQCSEEVFADIPYTLAGDGKSAAVMQLVQLGAEERFANDLVSAMASPLQQATLQAVRLDPEHPDGVRIIGKLTLIEGLYGLWMLVSRLEENNPTIEIIPCDAVQAKKSIDELLKALVS